MAAVGSNYQILCHFLSKTCTSGCDVRSYGRCLLYKASLPANTPAAGTSYTRHKNRMRPMSKYLPNMENIFNLFGTKGAAFDFAVFCDAAWIACWFGVIKIYLSASKKNGQYKMYCERSECGWGWWHVEDGGVTSRECGRQAWWEVELSNWQSHCVHFKSIKIDIYWESG